MRQNQSNVRQFVFRAHWCAEFRLMSDIYFDLMCCSHIWIISFVFWAHSCAEFRLMSDINFDLMCRFTYLDKISELSFTTSSIRQDNCHEERLDLYINRRKSFSINSENWSDLYGVREPNQWIEIPIRKAKAISQLLTTFQTEISPD